MSGQVRAVLQSRNSEQRQRSPAGARHSAGGHSAGWSPAALIELVGRNKWDLLLAGLLGAALLASLPTVMTEQFRASARLLVDPRDLKILDREVNPGTAPSDGILALVESQAQVLVSDNVLKKVVTDQVLTADPEFNGDKGKSLSGLIWSQFGIEPADAPEPENVALAALKKKAEAVRLGRSFILELTVKTEERDKSRRIVEAIIAAYLQDQASARAEAASSAGSSIDAGIEDLKNKVIAAEKRVN